VAGGILILDGRSIGIVSILFLATFIRSAFGFGEALVAVPLLALIMPVETAAPVAVLTSITVAAIILLQDWRKVHARSAMLLIVFTLLGMPLGLLLLTRVDSRIVKSLLAILIMVFAIYSLTRRHHFHLKSDRWAGAFGFVAGILGGAYGMNGPPLVVYGSMRGWSPQHFRATLQGYFLPASLAGMFGYWLAGLWTRTVTHDYLLALPAVVVAIFVGRFVNHRMSGRSFLRYVHIGLIVIGAILLVQSFR
jgi:uncharacterized membrane protein YfcA